MSVEWELCVQHGGIGRRRTCTECNTYPETCPNPECDWKGPLKDCVVAVHTQACGQTCEYHHYHCPNPKCVTVIQSYTRHTPQCSTTTKRRK